MSRICALAHSGAAWVVAGELGPGDPASAGAGVWGNAGFAFPLQYRLRCPSLQVAIQLVSSNLPPCRIKKNQTPKQHSSA